MTNSPTAAGAVPELLDLARKFTGLESLRVSREDRFYNGSGDLAWEGLLQRPVAVVLGEAGMGKTSEFRRKVHAMRDAGQAAFFLPVEAVAKRGVESSLKLPELKTFQAWRDGGQEAWFFLDSVDESTLHGSSLEDALDRFTRELYPGLARLHVVLSCRVSDWRKVDEAAVSDIHRLVAGAQGIKDDEKALVVQLAPLGEAQVLALAEKHGLVDSKPFVDAVRASNAWSFLERPLDVEWLTRHWLKYKRLGSQRELLDNSIRERLSERVDRKTTLTPARARAGAAKLAFVSVLSGRLGIQVPGTPAPASAEDTLDAQQVLSDWSADEVRDLLARGLFDQATYGRVRIHHRSALEFLAAEQVQALIGRGMAREQLNALFFRRHAGRVLVPRGLAATAAWVAIHDAAFRSELTRIGPEHLIDEGDPAALPTEANDQIVRAYASRYSSRKRVFFRFDPAGLRRFAGATNVTTIEELLRDTAQADHVREVLLEIVEEGRLTAAVASALEVALAEETTPELRASAIDAVAAAGSREQIEQLDALYSHSSLGQDRVAAALLRAGIPFGISCAQLLAVLHASQPARGSYHLHEAVTTKALTTLDDASRLDVLRGLLPDLVDDASGPGGDPKLNASRVWLLDILAVIVRDLLHAGQTGPEITACLNALYVHKRYGRGTYLHEAKRILKDDVVVRQAMFWCRAARESTRGGSFPRAAYRVDFDLGDGDVEWLVAACCERRQPRERLLAFDALMSLTPSDEKQRSERRLLVLATAQRADDAYHDGALNKHWERSQNRPYFAMDRSWQLQGKAYKLAEQRQYREDCQALRKDLDGIRDGKNLNALIYLHTRARAEDGSQEDRISPSIDVIREKFGGDIADAAEAGFKRFWRDTDAITPVEFGDEGTHPWSATIALAGIELEVRDGMTVPALRDELLRKAVIHAMWQLNGFPEWLDECAKQQPAMVQGVFAETLEHDIAEQDLSNPERTGYVLGRLTYAGSSVQKACAPVVERWVQTTEPKRGDRLRCALDLLECVESEVLADPTTLIEPRTEAAAADYPRFAVWWCSWVVRDPSSAIRKLEEVLAKAKDADALVLQLCSRLEGLLDSRHGPPRLGALSSSATSLGRLNVLLRRHVREAEDIDRSGGGAYSPTLRDVAQEVRNKLLNLLASIPGTDTVDALDALSAQHHPGDVSAAWIEHLAEQRSLTDLPTMTPNDAAQVIDGLVVQPGTGDELFALAVNRIKDTAFDVANGDFSFRQVFNPKGVAVLEEPVQNFLASELEKRSKGQFVVSREDEVTRRKKPDIRVRNPRCEEPITLEVKIAERWKLNQLEIAITDQLVGQYMADNKSRHGVLVLCSSGPSKTWSLTNDTGTRSLDFQQLREHLHEIAQKVVDSTPGIIALSVVAIDFH